LLNILSNLEVCFNLKDLLFAVFARLFAKLPRSEDSEVTSTVVRDKLPSVITSLPHKSQRQSR